MLPQTTRLPSPLLRTLIRRTSLRTPPAPRPRNQSTTANSNPAQEKSATPPYHPESINPKDPRDNSFNRERAALKRHSAETAVLWRKLSLYVAAPAILLTSINAWKLWNEHWSHYPTIAPNEIRVEYPYQNIRVKKFPWGDGDKTLFWNDKVNYHKRNEM